jgi:hypothetical protein
MVERVLLRRLHRLELNGAAARDLVATDADDIHVLSEALHHLATVAALDVPKLAPEVLLPAPEADLVARAEVAAERLGASLVDRVPQDRREQR